ncbi:MAG: LysR substrate-binding domain-containing protein [Pseudomonadales bacterium]|nr:LysR substrate-binding domain-containing protein [Pseudomonadales bacterium]NRA16092.1 LysR family transcriptional regulator [Oceanospirillaceae bacterium]
MKRHIPLTALKFFRQAAESLSFKLAAEQLFVTQAAVSQQIKSLENSLNVKLFIRLNREVVLTEQGKKLLPYVVQGFNAFEEGFAMLGDDPNPDLLTITTLPSFASRWLMPKLINFQERNNGISIHISPSLQVESFSDGKLDLAIRYGLGNYPGYETHLLHRDYILPVCHPDMIDTTKEIAPQLADIPLLTDEGVDIDKAWRPFMQKVGIPLNTKPSKLHVGDSTMLIEPLLCKQGMSLLRYSLIYELLKNGQLICPLPFYFQSRFSYYLVAPESHFQYQKIINFHQWIREEMSDIDKHWHEFSDGTMQGLAVELGAK